MLEFRISEDDNGLRLDKFLRRTLPNVPTSHVFKMIRVKKVRVNGKRAKPEQHLAKDDVITIRGDEAALRQEREHTKPPPPPVDLNDLVVLHEDDWLLIIDKPSGMAVHTGSGITGGTVVDLVRAYLGPKATRNGFTASPAHRIDRDTSGVLVVAKRRPAMVHFTEVFTKHLAKKQYLVLVKGKLQQTSGLIDLPLSEHQQTAEVTQCLKIISRPGSEKIARYAFRYAKLNQRKKVTCMTKDNIMKITDGLFHRVFNEVAQEFPDIETEHLIVDIGTARLADTPQDYDVVVMPNLYGDIVSDVVGQISGSVGLAGSANIGEYAAMFEAIHGSAPSIAGKDIANPSGLLLAAVMMLAHLGQAYTASAIHNAWLRTIEDGLHTADIYRPGRSSMLVGTQEFARGVIDRLGQNPRRLKPAQYFTRQQVGLRPMTLTLVPPPKKLLVGVDVFLDWRNGTPDDLAKIVEPLAGEGFKLSFITNRGSKVWPEGIPETFCTDHWRCRYEAAGEGFTTHTALIDLLARFQASGLDFIKTENLYTFDGKRGFSEAGAA
jgi:isocitrate dehydrogenase